MIFCGNCGAKIPNNVKFCPKCGAKVSDFSAPKNQSPNSEPTNNTAVQQPVNNNNQGFAPNNSQNINPNPSQNIGSTASKGLNGILNNPKVKQNKTLIIIALIVIVVGGFMFSRTAKFRDMTTSSSAKISYIDNWMKSSSLDYGTTTSISGNKIIFKANDEGKLIDFLDAEANNRTSDSDVENVRNAFQRTSEEVNKQWGDKYQVEVQNSFGKTLFTAQDGKTLSNNLDYDGSSDYDSDY
ncbi:zinc ribbon domain-containing protein [Companilactobacillus sp.]|uniref:zinc ribbon domain-containing protein n=1 Tax=Companilactobacillus sp. TaxID=2767905 RepID=UPI00260E78F9|nr:zinc ribbon domain-containing protein [Companilactobacillus sp.]